MTTLNLKCFKGALLLLFFILLINGISAAPIVVNTTSSTGAGSLTEAIATANASAGYDTILFNIPGTGPHEINYTGWPGANMSDIVITSGVFIDGFSQPGASCGTPLIRINGHGTWGNWTINGANGVVIRGLSITNTQVIINGGSNNRIYGCWFDVAPDGTLVNDNNNASLLLNGTTTGNIIGSTSCRNVFGGAASMAIQIDAGCNSNKIVANYIGTNSTGTALLGGFTSNGIQVSNSINTTIDSNTVVNCGQHGIFITTGNCSGTMIRGNNIGVGADGLKGAGNFGNGSSGIIFNTDNTTSNVTISGNIVAGNGKNLGNVDDVEHGCGIFIKQPGVDFLRINNNIVGVDKNYQLSGNNYAGIYVRSGSDSVTIIGNI
ncbi:MAG TPA: hypothetical protein VIK89_12320, partial [Cytophagaceae bacterium]